MKKTLFYLFFCACFNISFAQNDSLIVQKSGSLKKFYTGIEVGFKTYNSSFNEYDFIREESSYYYSYKSYSGTTSSTIEALAKLKLEYRANDDKFWLSTGINYSNISFEQEESGYFYVMQSQDNDDTYYYRVNKLTERNHYLGLPVDIRYSPFLPRFFRLYFKLGFDFNLLIASNRKVHFYDADMHVHEDKVLDLFNKPDRFYSAGTLGVGFQLGKQNKPNVRLEANVPAFIITQKTFGFMTATAGGGVSVSFVLPLNN